MEICDKYTRKILKYKDLDLYVVFYSDWCPYCKTAFELLKNKDKSFKGYNIDKINGQLDTLLECFNNNKDKIQFNETHKTRPIIFFKGQYIGGYDKLKSKLE